MGFMGSMESKNKFKDFLLSQGLKSTNQRELILEEFLRRRKSSIYVCARITLVSVMQLFIAA